MSQSNPETQARDMAFLVHCPITWAISSPCVCEPQHLTARIHYGKKVVWLWDLKIITCHAYLALRKLSPATKLSNFLHEPTRGLLLRMFLKWKFGHRVFHLLQESRKRIQVEGKFVNNIRVSAKSGKYQGILFWPKISGKNQGNFPHFAHYFTKDIKDCF